MENLNLNNKKQKKSPEDRNKLKQMKRQHKESVLGAGMNPKKVMNPPNQKFEK